MKKLLLIFLIVIGLSGCGTKDAFDAEECFKTASHNMQELNALTSETTMKMTLSLKDNSEKKEENFEFDSIIKADNLLHDDLTYQMSVTTTLFGETNKMEQWFVDDTVYTIEGNHRYALTLDDDEIAADQDKVIQGLDFGEVLKYQGKRVGDKKIISIKLNEEKIKELLKKFNIDLKDNAKKLNFSDIELTVNEDGYFENEQLNINFEIEGIEVNADVNVKFSDYNDVTIDEFDKASFNNIDAVLNETKQAVSDKLLEALAKIGYQNYGKGIFVKEVDGEATYTLDLGYNYLAVGEKLFDLNLNTYFDDETSCIYDFNNNLSEGECNQAALDRAKQVSEEAQTLIRLIDEYR